MMDAQKRRRIEAAGWKVSGVADFLCLSPQEQALVEAKVARAALLKAFAKRLGRTSRLSPRG